MSGGAGVGGRGEWRIGGYVADELIGYGASAQVWRGHVGRTGEPVALKVLDLADQSAVRAATAEAALLSVLDHPNLVRLRELVPDDESIVLVLELAAGGSLAQLLDRRGRLSPGEVVSALSPIAAALAYAHDEGVVHCDVSPANVLFRADGSALLADLGVARLLGGFEPPRSTLAYVDPGVAAGAVPSEASDVFMVAATALHALTGSPPWSGDTPAAVLDHAVTGEIDALAARLSGLPVALADVLRRGLDPAPVVRGSAAEFALDLRHAAAPVPVDLGVGPTQGSLPPWVDPLAARTDVASARAELRSQLTSAVRRRDDSAAGVYAPVPEPAPEVVGSHGRDWRALRDRSSAGRLIFGRRAAGRVRLHRLGSARSPVGPAETGREHRPRHAAGTGRNGAAPALTSAARPDRRAAITPGRPDFPRPDGPRPDFPLPDGPRRDFPRREGGHSGSPAGRGSAPPGRTPRVSGPAQSAAGSGPAGSVGAAVSGAEQVSLDPPVALTHIVRSRIRPADPPPRRRWRIDRTNRFWPGVVALVVVALLTGATTAWLRWEPSWPLRGPGAPAGRAGPSLPAGASTASGPAAPTPGRTSVSSGRTSAGGSRSSRPNASPPRAGPTSSTTAPPQAKPTSSATAWPTSDAGWTAVLANLDLVRQRAFAAGDPDPLSKVYADVALLRQDRATLRQVVAPGCQLIGLRTIYRGVHASSLTAGQVVLSTRASLTPARLVCPHRPPQETSAHPSVAMTVVLERVGGQFQIAAIRVPT